MIRSHAHLLEVFFAKLQLNLQAEVSKTYLGYVWWVLEPALYVAVLYFVFGVFLARGGPDFVAFLVCGKVPFLWFAKSVTNSTNSIKAGKGLINQLFIPKAFFPLLVVFQDLVKQAFVFILMFIVLAAFGFWPQIEWLMVLFVILTQFLLIVPCTLFAALVTTYIPDFRFLVQTTMTLLLFGSGIFYSYKDVILPQHQELFLLNPVARLLKNYRQVLMDYQQPDWGPLLDICVLSLAATALLLHVYRRLENRLARLVTQ